MNQISITDGGSKSQLAHVDIQEVLADGVVDTGDEITIMGRELFAGVASEAHLCRKDFAKLTKFPRTTMERSSTWMAIIIDLDVSFADETIRTTVYIKVDASDQLLSSEGVCRQLGIDMYHHSVQPRKAKDHQKDSPMGPTVRVQLVKMLCSLLSQSAVVEVDLEGRGDQLGQLLIVGFCEVGDHHLH